MKGRPDGLVGGSLGGVAAAITLSAMGMAGLVPGHEERVRRTRSVITHTHSEKPPTKRQKRRLRGKASS